MASPLKLQVEILCPTEFLSFLPRYPNAAAFPISVHVSSCLPTALAKNLWVILIPLFLSYFNSLVSLITRSVSKSYQLHFQTVCSMQISVISTTTALVQATTLSHLIATTASQLVLCSYPRSPTVCSQFSSQSKSDSFTPCSEPCLGFPISLRVKSVSFQ